MNLVTLMGRFTKAPELTQTPQGTSVLKFTLAVTRKFAKEGQQQADFINCTAWRGTAEFIARNFSKGDMIAVTGNLQINTWEKDGKKHHIPDININEVYFTGKKTTPTGEIEPVQEFPHDDFAVYEPDDDDIPF